MPAITVQKLNDAALDVDHITAVATSTDETVFDRFGGEKLTMAGASNRMTNQVAISSAAMQANIALLAATVNRSAWVTGTAYSVKDVAHASGTWYMCITAHTSAAAFATDAAKWVVHQVINSDLALSPATNMRNSRLIADAMLKIRLGTAVIACQGDSLTYGYDVVSGGTIAPTPPHTVNHVPLPYPETLQIELNRIFCTTGITVVNRGFSGDTAQTSFSRWTTPAGADLVFLMLGTNDAEFSGISITDYQLYMNSIIKRYNDWGAGVVIITSPSLAYGAATTAIESYRFASTQLGCPVFRGDEVMLSNSYAEVYSDTVHFNQSGYTLLANSLAAFIASGGLLGHQNSISNETTLLYTNESHVATNAGIYLVGSGASVTQGLALIMNKDSNTKATIAFYLNADAAYVTVVGRLSIGQNITFDSNSIRGNSTREGVIAKTTTNYIVSKNFILSEPTNALFLGQIIGRGWHSVTISCPTTASTTESYLHALRITPRSQDDCSSTVFNITRRSFSKFDPPAPSVTTPGGSTVSSFVFEGALFGSLFSNTTDYYASAVIDLCIANMIDGACSYTAYKIRVTSNGSLTATLVYSVGVNPITVVSVTTDSTFNSPGGNVTLNLNRPSAGYAEIRFDIPNIPQLLNIALM